MCWVRLWDYSYQARILQKYSVFAELSRIAGRHVVRLGFLNVAASVVVTHPGKWVTQSGASMGGSKGA